MFVWYYVSVYIVQHFIFDDDDDYDDDDGYDLAVHGALHFGNTVWPHQPGFVRYINKKKREGQLPLTLNPTIMCQVPGSKSAVDTWSVTIIRRLIDVYL